MTNWADPADLQTTAAEGRAAQAGAGALWEELATLDQHLAEVRREDCDPVDRVAGPHHQRREGVHVDQADPVGLGHGLDDAVERTVPGDHVGRATARVGCRGGRALRGAVRCCRELGLLRIAGLLLTGCNAAYNLLREALADPAAITEGSTELVDGSEHHLLIVADAVAPITLYVNVSTGQLTKLTTLENDHLRRDVEIEVAYENWTPADGGLSFPNRVLVTLDGERVHEETRTSIAVNQPFDAALVELPTDVSPEFDQELADWGAANHHIYRMMAFIGFPFSGQSTNVETVEIADGVHHVLGSSHHTLVIEQEEGIVVAVAPLHELRSEAVLTWVKATFPNKPITHVIPTHHHTDHSSGLRTYVAEGATVVVHPMAREFFENVFQAASTVLPDRLAQNPVSATIETLPADGAFTIPDAALPVEVYPLRNDHAEDMVLIYVRNAGVVFVSDIYNPNPAATDAGAGGRVVNNGIVANNLRVSTIAGGHGATIGYRDFQTLLGE